MTAQILLMATLTSIVLWGCLDDNQASGDQQTVSWYVTHPQERAAKLKWCEDDLVRLQAPDCINATTAAQKSWLDSNQSYKSKL